MAHLPNSLAVEDDEYRWLWAIFSSANLELAQRMCPQDFNFASLDPDFGKTALQVLITPLMTRTALTQDVMDMARWMINQGADPTLKAEGGSDDERDDESDAQNDIGDKFWKGGLEHLHVRFLWSGKSSIEAVINLIESMREQTSSEVDKIDWTDDINDLLKLLSIFSEGSQAVTSRKVNVATGVVDLWETMCQDTSSHDFTFQSSHGPVTAHAAVLAKCSPVLGAMLSTNMSEAEKRQIEVADTPAEAVRLLLSLVYTGSTTSEFVCPDLLGALDLAHRWQIDFVVSMLENALAEHLTDGNFAIIAEAAKLKSLPLLMAACKRFGGLSCSVQARLRAGDLPRPVLELMGSGRKSVAPAKRRRVW